MVRISTVSFFIAVALLGLPNAASAEVGANVVFSRDEIRIISAWYEEHGGRSHQGGTHKRSKGLPPGIAKNLARGKPLPPGIAKRFLPDGLRQSLPAPPSGYERIVVDGKVLLVEIATRIIHDILVDAVIH